MPQPVSDDSDGDSGADTGPHGAATASVTTKSHSDSGASEETSNNAGRGSYNAPSGGFILLNSNVDIEARGISRWPFG